MPAKFTERVIMDSLAIGWPGGDWQTTLKLVGVVLGTYYAAVWLSSVVWAYRDIRERTRDPLTQILAVFMVLVFSLPGLLLYLILRPRHTLADAYERTLEEEALLQGIEEQSACPQCKRRIEAEFVVCPFCAFQLREPCSNCKRPTSHAWVSCPFCGTPKRQALRAPEPRRERPAVAGPARPAATAPNGGVPPVRQPAPAPQPAGARPDAAPAAPAEPRVAAAARPVAPAEQPPARASQPAPAPAEASPPREVRQRRPEPTITGNTIVFEDDAPERPRRARPPLPQEPTS